jgi:transposase
MSNQELDRYDIIKRLIRGDLNGTEASELIGLSIRQTKRLKATVKRFGIKGIAHGNRGKKSNRRLPDKERKKIIELLHKHYPDFWPTHASEKLNEVHNICHDPKTIRQIMIDEGLWKLKKIKKKEYREWRQRRPHYGEMQQFDGSYHNWLEDRTIGKQCLLLSIDDATSKITHAKFDEHEGVFPVYDFWLEYLQIHGKPMSIYMDRFSTYSMNHKLAKENPDTLTQFQRAMRELRIEPILAQSAEAKGRVETVFGTLQNRLVKEMRLKKINTVKQANEYLKKEFIPWYNIKYSVQARTNTDLHNKLITKERNKLSSIFTKQEIRIVQNDFTISYKTNWYQLSKQQPVTVQKKDKVTIEEKRDHSINIRLRGRYLNYKLILKGQKQIKRHIPWILHASTKIKQKNNQIN